MEILYENILLLFQNGGWRKVITEGLRNTLLIAILGLLIGIVIGTIIAIVRVMPKKEELPIPEELKSIAAHSLRAKRGGGFAESHEIRPYRAGDSLNLIHWKLSAKADELMLREPMEPNRGLALLTLDINGTSDELDRKFSRLLNYGSYLLKNSAAFEVLALTAKGIESLAVHEESDWIACIDSLLCAPFAPRGSVKEQDLKTLWHCHIGGERDET